MKKKAGKLLYVLGTGVFSAVMAYIYGIAYEQGRKRGAQMKDVNPERAGASIGRVAEWLMKSVIKDETAKLLKQQRQTAARSAAN